jgi:hypothetical protein
LSDEKIIDRAVKRAAYTQEMLSEVYRKAYDDLRFISDTPGAMWDEQDYSARLKRSKPCLEIDQLKQFINQVANDSRMNTPNIAVIPHAGGSDIETAEIIEGLIKDIEYYSNADSAYDLAVTNAIKCSLGFLRVEHRYVDQDSFDQELCIKRVPFPLSVYLDPDSTEIDGSDARYAFVFEDITIDEFKSRYGEKEAISFEANKPTGGSTIRANQETVRIAEYFELIDEKKKISVDDMGNIIDGGKGGRSREVIVKTKVMRYVLSGADVLEESVFPGKYIPIVPVYGEESFIDGRKQYQSLIRKSKDPQRRYNYWASTEADLLMRAPKGMFLAPEGVTEQYAQDYQNPEKAMVLRYSATDLEGRAANPPQYIPPPQIPSGIVGAMQQALEDIKSTMGLYNAFLGQRSNETSGVAINARKQEGDRAVFHFTDNLTKSICHLGTVIVNCFPDIYDTPRIVKMVSKEGKDKDVGINGAVVEGQKRDYYITEGIYNVRVVTGPNYATQRQQAAEFYQKVLQTNVDLMPVIGDLAFEHMDFPGAIQISNRLKKTMDPMLLDDGDRADPALMAAEQKSMELEQILQQMQGEMQMLQKKLDDKQAEIQVKIMAENNDVQADQNKNALELQKMQLEERKLAVEFELKQAEIQLKARELELKQQETILNAQTAQMQAQQPAKQEQVKPDPSLQPAQSDNSEAMAYALAGIAQAMNNTAAPKKIIRNKQGLIDQIV